MASLNEERLRKLAIEIHSILLSSKDPITQQQLQWDFKSMTGKYIPYADFGHRTLAAFLGTISDYVQIVRSSDSPQFLYCARPTEKTRHLARLIRNTPPKTEKNWQKPFWHEIPPRRMPECSNTIDREEHKRNLVFIVASCESKVRMCDFHTYYRRMFGPNLNFLTTFGCSALNLFKNEMKDSLIVEEGEKSGEFWISLTPNTKKSFNDPRPVYARFKSELQQNTNVPGDHEKNEIKSRLESIVVNHRSPMSIYDLRIVYQNRYGEELKIYETFGMLELEFFQIEMGHVLKTFIKDSVLFVEQIQSTLENQIQITPIRTPEPSIILEDENDDEILATLADELKALSAGEKSIDDEMLPNTNVEQEQMVCHEERVAQSSCSNLIQFPSSSDDADILLQAFLNNQSSVNSELNVRIGNQSLNLNGVEFFAHKAKWHAAIQILVDRTSIKWLRINIERDTCPEFVRLLTFLLFELRPDRLLLLGFQYKSLESLFDFEEFVVRTLNHCKHTLEQLTICWIGDVCPLFESLSKCQILSKLHLTYIGSNDVILPAHHLLLSSLSNSKVDWLRLENVALTGEGLGKICNGNMTRTLRLDSLPLLSIQLTSVIHLTLDGQASVDVIQLFAQKMPALQTLTLNNCTEEVFDQVLQFLSMYRCNLECRTIRLFGLNWLNIHGIIFNWLQHLKQISLKTDHHSLTLSCNKATVVFSQNV